MATTPPESTKHGLATGAAAQPENADWTISQGWEHYTAADHATWKTLFQRQTKLLPGRACDEFLQAQDAMGMSPHAIPKYAELNAVLGEEIGRLYVANYFGASDRAKVAEMVGYLRNTYRDRIQKLEWMDAPTRAEALVRLDSRLPGQPIAALTDTQVIGTDDPASLAVWQAHRARMAARAATASTSPCAGWCARPCSRPRI